MFKNPLVVGYKGEIGSFILNGLLRTMPKALNIWCFDINETEKEKITRIKKSDVIFLCIPMQDTVNWFEKYQKYLKNKTVIEQTSIKGTIFESRRFAICYYTLLSMHILFRPSITPNKEDRETILIKQNNKYWEHDLENMIEKITNSKITYIDTYKNHDLLMAYQQALIHRVLLSLNKTTPMFFGKTYIGKQLDKLVKRIQDGDSTLYLLIQKNKYLQEALNNFTTNLNNFDIKKEMQRRT